MRDAPAGSLTPSTVHYRDWADGALVIEPEGRIVPTTARQRAVLDALGESAGREVSTVRLIEMIWGDSPPASARASLHNLISRLRAAGGDEVVRTSAQGYRLMATRSEERVRAQLRQAEGALTEGRATEALDLCDAADDTLNGAPPVEARDRLSRLLKSVRLRSLVALGRLESAIDEGLSVLDETPLDEGTARIVADALAQAGRRGEALAVISKVRRGMREEFGLGLSADLRSLEHSILTDDVARESVGSLLPFVGREGEIAALIEALSTESSVRVVAEPGGGVTRLLRELIRVHDSRASEPRRIVLVTSEAHPEAALSVLDDVLSALESPADALGGVVSTFGSALDAAAHDTPVTVVVDDAQHCGRSSREILSSVAAQNPRVNVVWAGHGLGVPHAEVTIELSPLSADQVGAALEGAGYEKDVDRVVALSGGNPHLVSILASEATNSSASESEPTTDLVSMARAVIWPLFARVTERERDVLEVIAIAGGEIDIALLRHVVRTPSVVEAVQARSELVTVVASTVRLRHGLATGVIAHDIPPGRRAELHWAIATAAEKLQLAASLVAHHALNSGLDSALTHRAAHAAGRAATNEGAHRDAARWFSLAAEHAVDERQRTESLIEYGDALRLAGDPSHLDILLKACEWSRSHDDDELLGRAAWALLQLGSTTPAGSVDPRIPEVIDAVLAGSHPPLVIASVASAASLALSLVGDGDRARSLFDQAEAASRLDSRPDAEARSARRRVLRFAYLSLAEPSQWHRRDALTEELRALARRDDDPDAAFEAEHLRFSSGVHRGQGSLARDALDEMRQLVTRSGDVGHRWELLYCGAALAQLEGDSSESIRLSERALRLFHPVSAPRAEAAHASQLFSIHLFANTVGGLIAHLEKLAQQQEGVPAWQAALSVALSSTGDLNRETRERATHAAHTALAHDPHDFTSLTLHTLVGRAAIGLADVELGEAVWPKLAPWHDRIAWQGTTAFGSVAAVLAGLAWLRGDADAARSHREHHESIIASANAPGIRRDPAMVVLDR